MVIYVRSFSDIIHTIELQKGIARDEAIEIAIKLSLYFGFNTAAKDERSLTAYR